MGSKPSSDAKREAWDAEVTVKHVLVNASVGDLQRTVGDLVLLPSRSVRRVAEMAIHTADVWMWTKPIFQDGRNLVVSLVMGVSPDGHPVILGCRYEQFSGNHFSLRERDHITHCLEIDWMIRHFPGARCRVLERDPGLERLLPADLIGPYYSAMHSSCKPLFWHPDDHIYRWMRGYRRPNEEPESQRVSTDFLQSFRLAIELLHSAFSPSQHTPVGV